MPPHSPGYSSETDGLHPRSFADAFQQHPSSTRLHPTITESRTLIEFLQSHASSTPSLPTIAISIACPRGSQPAKSSERISLPQSGSSPSAAASSSSSGRKKQHQDLRIEITTDEDDGQQGPRTVPLPHEDSGGRTTAARRMGISHGPRSDATRKSSTGKRQTLAVPPTKSPGRDSDSASTSPRHSPYSSRSVSSSSPSPEPTWMQCPRSPSLSPPSYGGQSPSIHRAWSSTSSRQRPLGLASCSSASNAYGPHPSPTRTQPSSDWDESSWMEWNRINQQKGDDIQGQETPV